MKNASLLPFDARSGSNHGFIVVNEAAAKVGVVFLNGDDKRDCLTYCSAANDSALRGRVAFIQRWRVRNEICLTRVHTGSNSKETEKNQDAFHF